jgi:hypothetical protein
MESTIDALIVDLLAWLQMRERTYQEAIDAWRTSCPRLTVWEDAHDRKLISTELVNGRELVRIAPEGIAFLAQRKIALNQDKKSESSRPA